MLSWYFCLLTLTSVAWKINEYNSFTKMNRCNRKKLIVCVQAWYHDDILAWMLSFPLRCKGKFQIMLTINSYLHLWHIRIQHYIYSFNVFCRFTFSITNNVAAFSNKFNLSPLFIISIKIIRFVLSLTHIQIADQLWDKRRKGEQITNCKEWWCDVVNLSKYNVYN